MTEPMILSQPIRVGSEWKSPYQWAAALAPEGELVTYKEALLWLEGEHFGSTEELRAKVDRVLVFQLQESTRTGAPAAGEWHETKRKGKSGRATGPKPRWTQRELAAAIVHECIEKMKKRFEYAGPSLNISEVYDRFDPHEFTYPNLISAVRAELQAKGRPVELFGVKNSARYWAASSPGKGKNFNFKVQEPDKTKPGGWSAIAQIHVLWS